MGQRIILTENEKLNIRKMYGMINETSETGCISGNCENGVGTWVFPNDDELQRLKFVGEIHFQGVCIFKPTQHIFTKNFILLHRCARKIVNIMTVNLDAFNDEVF